MSWTYAELKIARQRFLRGYFLRLDPRRGRVCGDLECICDACTTPDCPCAGAVVESPQP